MNKKVEIFFLIILIVGYGYFLSLPANTFFFKGQNHTDYTKRPLDLISKKFTSGVETAQYIIEGPPHGE